MGRNRHVESVASWQEARRLLDFEPRIPAQTARQRLQSLCIFMRDHKLRELPRGERTLEAHYGLFVLTQQRCGVAAARHQALELSYGAYGQEGQVAGHPARVYERGPEVPDDDIDGRSPAVVVWCDGEMFYLVATGSLAVAELQRIAGSLYD